MGGGGVIPISEDIIVELRSELENAEEEIRYLKNVIYKLITKQELTEDEYEFAQEIAQEIAVERGEVL